jgi:hypothetical protein
MFIDTSRRRSPSTGHLASCERIAATSASVRSLTRVVGECPRPARISSARERPMPKYVRQPDAHVLVHRDIDAGYACHDALPQPWRCLWRASELQIT